MPEMPEQELRAYVEELIDNHSYYHNDEETVYALVGILDDDVPEDIKKEIIDFLYNQHRGIGNHIALLLNLNKTPTEIERWMERWQRRSKLGGHMHKNSDMEASNPIFFQVYLDNFKNIMKRQFPMARDKELYQDAFGQMIDLILPPEKQYDEEYLKSLVETARHLNPPIELEIPTHVRMIINKKSLDKTETEEREKAESIEQKRKERGSTTLDEQLEQAISEERYEDAMEIKKKIDTMKRLMGCYDGTLGLPVKPGTVVLQSNLVITADNLDLVQPDKPYDIGNVRRRHRTRFRNEPGGHKEIEWEGMDGMKNTDKGIGSDQYSDVGVPASVNIASKKVAEIPLVRPESVFPVKKKINSPPPNMPNEKMERDPQEEKATTDTWREFNDMQER